MRARELLEENYNQSLESDLSNLLISAKGAGASQLQTDDLVNQMHDMGYSVSVNSLIPLLSNNPAVSNVTPEFITFAEPEGVSPDAVDDSAARVKDMAADASSLG